MPLERKLGRFTAPKAQPNRNKPKYWEVALEPKVLPATTSAPLRPITAPERELLAFLSKLSHALLFSGELQGILSLVKGHLFRKEYAEAFGSKEIYREAYFARYAPSRALVYRKIFRQSEEIMQLLTFPPLTDSLNAQEEVPVRKIVCLGGGAGSEVIAWGSLLQRIIANEREAAEEAGTIESISTGRIEVTAVDNCDWSGVLDKLHEGMMEEFNLTDRYSVEFVQADVLTSHLSDMDRPLVTTADGASSALRPTIDYASASLITLLFTISELFLQSRSQTLSLLNHLTASTSSGQLLLIIESASLAQIPIGSSGNTYPLGTLLDHNLCADKGLKGGDGQWKCVREEESEWYRMPEGAVYQLKLENTRVMLRLYRRV